MLRTKRIAKWTPRIFQQHAGYVDHFKTTFQPHYNSGYVGYDRDRNTKMIRWIRSESSLWTPPITFQPHQDSGYIGYDRDGDTKNDTSDTT